MDSLPPNPRYGDWSPLVETFVAPATYGPNPVTGPPEMTSMLRRRAAKSRAAELWIFSLRRVLTGEDAYVAWRRLRYSQGEPQSSQREKLGSWFFCGAQFDCPCPTNSGFPVESCDVFLGFRVGV